VAAAVNRPVKLTFPEELITEPIIYHLGQRFKIVTNIRRADIRQDIGWVVLELEGETDEIDSGLEWLTSKGVRVDPVSGDVVEG
jgi:ABC-type methionine transport system ATPase subunit